MESQSPATGTEVSPAVHPKTFANGRDELVWSDRFGEHTFNRPIAKIVRRPADNNDRDLAGLDVCRQIVVNLDAADVREAQIEHHEIRPIVVETAQRLQAVRSFGHLKAIDTQCVAEHGAEIVIVLDNENSRRHDKL